MNKCWVILGWCFINAFSTFAQSISGIVRDDKNIPLPFATVLVMGTDKGAVTNQEGYYHIDLEPGTYRLRFQFVGYRTKDTLVQIKSTITAHIRLSAESLTLPTAIIDGSNEDPAYTIMRRTIAKAPYHANQINSYSAKVYIKGSGRILKVPFLFRNRIKKELAKEGIDSTVAFTQESISKLSYKRPGQYRDTVVSVRTTGDDNNTSPMSFISSSFYEPKVAGVISPLAPNAFSIYHFEYLGFFEDHGSVINKIKVIPKSRGDQVFEGTIYITDQLWNIHSLDLVTSVWGIQFAMKHVFTPVRDDIWMPIDQIFDVGGNVFGFGFEYKYLSHISDYRIVPNPEISVPILVLDDKKEIEESKTANQKINSQPTIGGLSDLDPNQELSAKQLRKMMKEYKKKELDSIPMVEEKMESSSFTESDQVIDSLAHKRDSLYWSEVRPVALTDHEIKGYSRFDSLAKINTTKELQKKRKDSTTLNINLGNEGAEMNIDRKDHTFKLRHLLLGGSFEYDSNRHYINILPIFQHVHFNSVEGYTAGLGFKTGNTWRTKSSVFWSFEPLIDYSFTREKINYEVNLTFKNRLKSNKEIPWTLALVTGNKPQSFSGAIQRENVLNDLYSLLFKKNYLKLYDRKFLSAQFSFDPNSSVHFSIGLDAATRTPLSNNTNYSYFNRKKVYSSNSIAEIELLRPHDALISIINVSWTPFYKFIVNNGKKYKDRSGSPTFRFNVRSGLGLDSKFNHLEFGIKQHIDIGAGDDYDLSAQYGIFPGRHPEFFQDFAHFNGNQYIFSPTDPIKFFRALEYYSNSTNQSYFAYLSNYQFRKFLITRSSWVRKKGIRENILLNGLWTRAHQPYGELGYSINYLFRFLRLEAVTTWRDYKYQQTYFRFGLATGFENLFK